MVNSINNFWGISVPSFGIKERQCSTNPIIELEKQPSEDCFIRTTNAEEISTSQTIGALDKKAVKKEDKLYQLFESTYSEVMVDMIKSNPMLMNINLPMPKITITNFEDSTQAAAYNFGNNEIIASSNYDKDLCLVISRNADGSFERVGACEEKELDSTLSFAEKQGYENVEVLKLTEAEKEFKIKSLIAHELRHYTQQHLIASTEKCNNLQSKKYFDAVNDIEEKKQAYIDACIKDGCEPKPELVNKKSSIGMYWKEYKPTTLLDANSIFKFSQDENDNRYWSISQDFFEISEDLMNKEDNDETYYGRPTEIDAYNFECEYIKNHASEYGVRDDVKKYLIAEIQSRADEGYKYYCDAGHNFIQK